MSLRKMESIFTAAGTPLRSEPPLTSFDDTFQFRVGLPIIQFRLVHLQLRIGAVRSGSGTQILITHGRHRIKDNLPRQVANSAGTLQIEKCLLSAGRDLGLRQIRTGYGHVVLRPTFAYGLFAFAEIKDVEGCDRTDI